MLKALELQGFKSFADKTRLDFPDGITVVVGPNGSGKSNVVDGIRWVLGEQSAKSLRGSEMADVIFKGSGGGQRRPSNTAEVTIVFDNAEQELDIDSPEVRVSRRVYRSGEGEYLINDEPCRLRDIRDLFRGTGVGSDAYSIIEQGKVDTLLQASPRERRAIFEEAAGISRFRAKKVECGRRLERVEQNLLRLSDIVEEVERRLKSLRNQATKARRYREYSNRLKELRTHIGLTDFRNLSSDQNALQSELDALTERLAELEQRSESAAQEVADFDRRMASMTEEARHLRRELADLRESITGHETTVVLQRQSLLQLEQEEASSRRRMVAVNSRAGNMQQQLSEVEQQLAEVEAQYATQRAQADEDVAALQSVNEELERRRREVEAQQRHHAEQINATTQLRSQLGELEAELSLAANAIQRDQQRQTELEQQLAEAVKKVKVAAAEEAKHKATLDQASSNLSDAQQRLEDAKQQLETLTEQRSVCQNQLTAVKERSNVLEEIERRLEGIGAGTKDLLAQAKLTSVGPLGEIQGMVADLIEVKVEMAPLVDAALGDRAQYVVVSGNRMFHAIADGSVRLRGRVGLLSLAMVAAEKHPIDPQLAKEEQVIGHATQFVQVEPPWRELAWQLLGTTWFVSSVDLALRLREKYKTRPWRFVTPAAEVLEADGTLFGGPRLASGGLVARRSELRSLRSQLKRLTEQDQVLQQNYAQQKVLRDDAEEQVRAWSERQQLLREQYAKVHAEAETARYVEQQYAEAQRSLKGGLSELETTFNALSNRKESSLDGLGQLESLVANLEAALSAMQVEVTTVEEDRKLREERSTSAKFELAKLEQQLETLRMQRLRCQQDNEERTKTIQETQQQLTECKRRKQETTRAILFATSQLAELYLRQEGCEQALGEYRQQEDQITQARMEKSKSAYAAQQQLQTMQQKQNGVRLKLGELNMKRDALTDRMRDDYGLELAELQDELEESTERVEIDNEINDLRRKLNNIGAVNMESLNELDELEERFGSLSGQYEDLVQAKESLEHIIQKINVDSRRMFSDTLDLIRTNFQSLFRRAFGGGSADIVVEEGADVLEAGIEIIATPPGKHSLNISLLSGGERALTAVTLLLAIFRHRPSPFCILDEVDGPLDEANVGRFIDVLREFLKTTKVVIVTHSKKTMSAATTLYGITMQESGISKRVSVQFNDVAEDGTILKKPDDAA